MLVRCLAVEWRAARIAVNEIIPGPVRTDIGVGIIDAPTCRRRSAWSGSSSPTTSCPLALFLAGLPDDGPSGQVFSLLGRDLA